MIGGGQYDRGFAAGLDGKIKARPDGVLIVVVGVGVTEASREFACWRFISKRQRNQHSQRQLEFLMPAFGSF